jgi:hypothetical protein
MPTNIIVLPRRGISMRILRFFLLVASVVGAGYIFHALHVGSVANGERSIAWLFGLGLVLNIIFFLFCGPVAKVATSRMTARRIESLRALATGDSAGVLKGEKYALG